MPESNTTNTPPPGITLCVGSLPPPAPPPTPLPTWLWTNPVESGSWRKSLDSWTRIWSPWCAERMRYCLPPPYQDKRPGSKPLYYLLPFSSPPLLWLMPLTRPSKPLCLAAVLHGGLPWWLTWQYCCGTKGLMSYKPYCPSPYLQPEANGILDVILEIEAYRLYMYGFYTCVCIFPILEYMISSVRCYPSRILI